MGRISILRLGHRIVRDKRLTTHVVLTARAFGANEVIVSGERDDGLISKLEKFIEKWGGEFKIRFEENWREAIERWKRNEGKIIHLTMYGVNLPDVIEELRRICAQNDIMIIVGSQKVPREVYELADYNIAVSNQPHSEVAALAILLDWLFQGRELSKEFPNAELRIVPQLHGKKVIRLR
ncbi:MAG: tRNA (cytidine(56)-2'-O)-methyltransferase [Nitrososphaerota archaeon]